MQKYKTNLTNPSLVLFYVYPIRLLVPSEESPNVKRSDKTILLNVAISVFSHIQVCGRNDDFNEANIHRKSN